MAEPAAGRVYVGALGDVVEVGAIIEDARVRVDWLVVSGAPRTLGRLLPDGRRVGKVESERAGDGGEVAEGVCSRSALGHRQDLLRDTSGGGLGSGSGFGNGMVFAMSSGGALNTLSSVTILGTNLTGSTAVTLDGISATFTVVSQHSIEATRARSPLRIADSAGIVERTSTSAENRGTRPLLA